MNDAVSVTVLVSIFLGSFLDAFFLSSVFVFGEAVFLLAGGLAHGSGSALPILAAYSGAFLADQAGYGFGRVFRGRFRRFALATARRRRLVRRAVRALTRRGMAIVVVSRFLGPVAWVMPPLAGSLAMRIWWFVPASLVGVLLGVGQFLAIGWAGAWAAARGGIDLGAVLQDHFLSLLIAGQFGVLAVVLVVRGLVRRRPPAKG